MCSSDLSYSYLHNAHGDVTLITNVSGTVLWKYEYDAFGVEKEIAGQDSSQDMNPFRYCGEYFDKENGSIYLRARYYNPKLGRFITQDPINDGLNWYTYCNNSPLMHWDPSGMWMAGDEALSTAAQQYTQYYGEKWKLAYFFYKRAEGNGDKAEMQKYQNQMDTYHALAKDIRGKDAKNEVAGIVWDIDHVSQGDYNNCGMACEMMVTEAVENNTKDVAPNKRGRTGTYTGEENQYAIPNRKKIEGGANATETDLLEALENSPLYAEYNVPEGNSSTTNQHLIVINGIVSADGHPTLYIYNDPNDPPREPDPMTGGNKSGSFATREDMAGLRGNKLALYFIPLI